MFGFAELVFIIIVPPPRRRPMYSHYNIITVATAACNLNTYCHAIAKQTRAQRDFNTLSISRANELVTTTTTTTTIYYPFDDARGPFAGGKLDNAGRRRWRWPRACTYVYNIVSALLRTRNVFLTKPSRARPFNFRRARVLARHSARARS